MAYQKYLSIPNRRGNVGDRDHFQHIENSLDRIHPGPGEVVVGGPSGPIRLKLSDLGIDWEPPTDSYSEVQRTFSLIGDTHVGITLRPGNEDRLDRAFSDLATLKDLHGHRLYVGDMVENPGTGWSGSNPGANDIAFLARAEQLDPDRSTWDACVGNHDIGGGRNADQWAALYGYEDQNWTRDLGFCRIVSVGPHNTTDFPSAHQTLSAATVQWLDDQLAANAKDTIILSHGPLPSTADLSAPGGATVGGYTTTNASFASHPNDDLLAVLDKHPHARAWVCGHSHASYDAVGALVNHWTGSRTIAHINAGSIAYVNHAVASELDPVRSLFMTLHDDRITIRVRNHDTQDWDSVRGQSTITLPKVVTPPEGNPTAFVFPLNGSLQGQTPNGAMTLTTTGSPEFAAADSDGESALVLDTTGKDGLIDPNGVISPDQGSLVIRCTFGESTGVQYAINHPALEGENRIFLHRSNATGGAGATLGGGFSTGRAFDNTIPNGEKVTLALDWGDGEMVLRLNGYVIGRTGYSGLTKFGTTLRFGRSSAATAINGNLYGVAGFTRPLTDAEHDRLVTTPTDQWSMDTLA